MAMDVFKNPSTFTWIGRHASEFRFLVDSLDKPPEKVLDVGKGPFKPIYFAEMLPKASELSVIDAPEMCNLVEGLIDGRELHLPDLSTVVCNKDDTGKPIPNTDLTDTALLEVAASELRLAGLNPADYFDLSTKTFRCPGTGAWIETDNGLENLDGYLLQHRGQFDLVYLGLVLLNVGKVSGRQELVRLSGQLLESLSRSNSVLGVGEHPRALYGEKSIPNIVEESGGVLTDALVDNLVVARGNLRGGHCLRFTRQNAYSPIPKGEVDRRIESDELLRQLDVGYRQVDGDKIGNYLSAQHEINTDRLLVAALRRRGGYDVWEAPIARVMAVAPPKRKTLSLILGLGYKQGQ